MNKDGGPKYRCVVIMASQKMTPPPSNLRTRTGKKTPEGEEEEEEKKQGARMLGSYTEREKIN